MMLDSGETTMVSCGTKKDPIIREGETGDLVFDFS